MESLIRCRPWPAPCAASTSSSTARDAERSLEHARRRPALLDPVLDRARRGPRTSPAGEPSSTATWRQRGAPTWTHHVLAESEHEGRRGRVRRDAPGRRAVATFVAAVRLDAEGRIEPLHRRPLAGGAVRARARLTRQSRVGAPLRRRPAGALARRLRLEPRPVDRGHARDGQAAGDVEVPHLLERHAALRAVPVPHAVVEAEDRRGRAGAGRPAGWRPAPCRGSGTSPTRTRGRACASARAGGPPPRAATCAARRREFCSATSTRLRRTSSSVRSKAPFRTAVSASRKSSCSATIAVELSRSACTASAWISYRQWSLDSK